MSHIMFHHLDYDWLTNKQSQCWLHCVTQAKYEVVLLSLYAKAVAS